jgi:hypothetical protein
MRCENQWVRALGEATEERFRRKLRLFAADMDRAGTEELGLPAKNVRLAFTQVHAEAAVRYQVLGHSLDQITGGMRAKVGKERVVYPPVRYDNSNLRKVIQEFLQAVDIDPRPTRPTRR